MSGQRNQALQERLVSRFVSDASITTEFRNLRYLFTSQKAETGRVIFLQALSAEKQIQSMSVE